MTSVRGRTCGALLHALLHPANQLLARRLRDGQRREQRGERLHLHLLLREGALTISLLQSHMQGVLELLTMYSVRRPTR